MKAKKVHDIVEQKLGSMLGSAGVEDENIQWFVRTHQKPSVKEIWARVSVLTPTNSTLRITLGDPAYLRTSGNIVVQLFGPGGPDDTDVDELLEIADEVAAGVSAEQWTYEYTPPDDPEPPGGDPDLIQIETPSVSSLLYPEGELPQVNVWIPFFIDHQDQ